MAGRKKTTNKKEDITTQIESFKEDYPEAELAEIIPKENGQYQMVFRPKLPSLDPLYVAGVPDLYKEKYSARASTMYRDPLRRSDLDLAKPDVVNEAPHKLYRKMRGYYRSKDVFGSFVDLMVNLVIAGFENDCEDLNIKEFYDNWCQDIDIEQVLEWVAQELYITGFVRTYKVLGKYEPQVNRLGFMKNAPKPKMPKKQTAETNSEFAERKKRWSRGYVPIGYTVLNPTEIEIKGSIFLNQTRVVLRPNEEMEELVKREDLDSPVTNSEKKILDNIPSEIKSAIKSGNEIELDPEFVGEVDYRRMPFEKYPMPPFCRALEVVEYKEALKQSDYSTIDGITSEILVITVGDKDNPVSSEEDLRKVAQMFNTAQKSYAVVWNHTLKVDRLEVQNIDKIFGAGKFEQSETDMSGSMGLPRALLDGVVIGNTNKDALNLAVKAVMAEVRYARRQISRWLYNEYSQIAEAFGFERFPNIRWDEKVLKDELAIMAVVQGLVDRRIISYHTAHKKLDLDPEFEKKKMAEEVKAVKDGIFGILGSPYQQNKGGDSNQQDTQKAPKGSPSEGRPKGNPAPKSPSPSSPDGQTKEVINKDVKETKEEIRKGILSQFKQMSLSELAEVERLLDFSKIKKSEELVNLLQESDKNLED